jgi:hypothetical protein
MADDEDEELCEFCGGPVGVCKCDEIDDWDDLEWDEDDLGYGDVDGEDDL